MFCDKGNRWILQHLVSQFKRCVCLSKKFQQLIIKTYLLNPKPAKKVILKTIPNSSEATWSITSPMLKRKKKKEDIS